MNILPAKVKISAEIVLLAMPSKNLSYGADIKSKSWRRFARRLIKQAQSWCNLSYKVMLPLFCEEYIVVIFLSKR